MADGIQADELSRPDPQFYVEQAQRALSMAGSLYERAESASGKRVAAGLALRAAIAFLKSHQFTELDLAPLEVIENALDALGDGNTLAILKPAPQSRRGRPKEGRLATAKARAIMAVDELLTMERAKTVTEAIKLVADATGLSEQAIRNLRSQVRGRKGHQEIAAELDNWASSIRISARFDGDVRFAILMQELKMDRPLYRASAQKT